ncbi:PREDICTED: uncharacterized protein LOC105448003 [Wasmannia auropunctata]|uniref:uncharacterized protein LOC105448003 n=1 Tax=Wasmannia auropunctata TaxID=64793 RepID=UPI0005EF023B|nr:PREDICTED: uncharacterized protein LOC105448003 [Wasmannia auropunctata]
MSFNFYSGLSTGRSLYLYWGSTGSRRLGQYYVPVLDPSYHPILSQYCASSISNTAPLPELRQPILAQHWADCKTLYGVPRVWTRSTAIVANTDDHDRPGQHWVAFHVGEDDCFCGFDETPPHIDGIQRNFRERFLKHADNTAVYFYILCAAVIIFVGFLISLPMIMNATIVGL